MDKKEADPNRAMGELAEAGVVVEDWGGKIPMAKISAKKGTGIADLLELVLLVADIEKDHIRANPDRRAAGTVIESHVDKGEGPVATVLIQAGSLHRNEHLGIAGAAYGRVRAMRDWKGTLVDEATPGMPVKILGFKVAPAVGDIVEVPENPKDLTQKKVKSSHQVAEALTASKVTPTEDEKETTKKSLNVVIKTDVLGSLEAILGSLEKVKHDLVEVKVVNKGLGNVTEADIDRAANTQPSVVYGFNVAIPPAIEAAAREQGVEVIGLKVIYELFDDVVEKLNKLLPQETIVTTLGNAEVLAIFRTESQRMILGGKVKDGLIKPGAKVRVWRDEDPIGEGVIESLQSNKIEVKEVTAGSEFGSSFDTKTKVQVGDRLEVYTEELKSRKIETFR